MLGHQHGGRKLAETSVTEFCYKSANLSLEELKNVTIILYSNLYNNQINARALIGQSAVGYCYYKPTEKSCVF